jgi:hypothetical protein
VGPTGETGSGNIEGFNMTLKGLTEAAVGYSRYLVSNASGDVRYNISGNYPGANYRDLITFSYTQNSGAPGIVVTRNTYPPIAIFAQTEVTSIGYINVNFANTATSDLLIDTFNLIDLTTTTNYNFSAYNSFNGGTLLWQSGPITILAATSNRPFVYTFNVNIQPGLTARSLGFQVVKTTTPGTCQFFSVTFGFSVPV